MTNRSVGLMRLLYDLPSSWIEYVVRRSSAAFDHKRGPGVLGRIEDVGIIKLDDAE